MSSKDIDLKVRRVNFKFQPNPKHWFNNNPFATHFNNAFHLIFPDGEKFFIRSVKAYYSQIKDPVLKKQIDGFVGQEGTHFKEHQKFWKILEEQGFDINKFLNIYRSTAFDGAEKDLMKYLGKENGQKLALSVTVALEHFTALLAEGTFGSQLLNLMPEDMKHLMLWHSAEEIEHKAIPFNLLKEVDDSYVLRIAGMLIATLGLGVYTAIGMAILISQDKDIDWKQSPEQLLTFLTGMKNGPAKSISKNYFRYYDPNFHPDQIDNYHLAAEYLATAPFAN
jgi:hypothetical protein